MLSTISCAHIGHEARSCEEYLGDTANEEVREEKIGAWAKANQVGKRVENSKENLNPNSKKEGPLSLERVKTQTY